MFYPEKCIHCGKCAEGCYSGARVLCGRPMTPEEVYEQVCLDRDYYGKNGGVTVSGGEPLAHPEFTKAVLKLCRENGIGTAIETTMYRYDEEVLKLADVIMADMKIWDEELHKKYTGIGNAQIKENIKRADSLGIPMIIRTPVIVGVNDNVENISKTAEFLKSLNNVIAYELLPYHPLGLSKSGALGKASEAFEAPSAELMKELNEYADLSR